MTATDIGRSTVFKVQSQDDVDKFKNSAARGKEENFKNFSGIRFSKSELYSIFNY